MSNTNNNGVIAAIIEQTGGTTKSDILNNDAPTIVEKYQMPKPGPGRMDEIINGKDEKPMSDFKDDCCAPTLWLTGKQLPSASGLKVGDKVCLKIEAEVTNYGFNENSDGVKREEYTFQLNEGRVDKEDDDVNGGMDSED